jgi:hypothetical protein
MGDWREVFYLHTYLDSDAVSKPHLAPRSGKRYGPYADYNSAVVAGMKTPDISHFKIDKVYVNPLVIIEWPTTEG